MENRIVHVETFDLRMRESVLFLTKNEHETQHT
jgi:hypothetical protein